MFLSFTDFYRKFIKNFCRIIANLTLILQTIDKLSKNEFQTTKVNKVENNQNVPRGVNRNSDRRDIKKLLIIVKSGKSKELNFANSKKSDLVKKTGF